MTHINSRRPLNLGRCIRPIALVLVALGLSEAGPAAVAGPVYDANADYSAGFAAGKNPNGVWTYGWSSSLGSQLVVYPRHQISPPYAAVGQTFETWDDPNRSAAITPNILRNAGGAYNNGNIDFPAGALVLHGGGPSGRDYSHVLFTAPNAGTYDLATTFIGRQSSVFGDVHILRNGVSLFANIINGNKVSRSFSTTLVLLAGDRIDFAVGTGGRGLGPNHIELRATLTDLSTVPEPSSLVLAATGLIGALHVARKRRATV